eukprot:Phypoly_transcript_28267.p1 GENE.Phypoly_transcript_28267~~Phypoly_transcript_28267.p1  ORF type:complete len:119 (+),score=24.11 Phypoly_transcript_28267:28-384(+)
MVDNTKNINIIVNAIKKNGTPSTKYQGDIEITYGKLSSLVGDSIGGLMALLKTMKRDKVVDYSDTGMLKPDSVVSLLGGNDVATGSDQVPYEKIKDLITDEDKTSHNKIGAATDAVRD